MSATTFDLRTVLKPLYSPKTGEVQLVRVPKMKHIVVDGDGEPGAKSFQEAMGVIFSLAYTMKFRSKNLLKKDYSVMAPEGLWWMKGKFDPSKPKEWMWSLRVVVPDFITTKTFSDTVEEVKRKKNPPGLDRARLETFDEGPCIQTLHIGPYSAEAETIAKLEAFAKEHGYKMVGKHHEIYLGDPRRAPPSKLRTIIRHPVAKAT